ncbi:MAG TPA: hypothetical protein VH877_14285 [Polyangia bacterium]|jgi:hypothetical protein|nr:hypothetical protein [Polyangia bacterium]
MAESTAGSSGGGKAFIADKSQWPFVTLLTPKGEIDVGSFFSIIDSCLERQSTFVVLHDIRGMGSLSPLQRKQFSEYIKSREMSLKQYIAAHAVVVSSAIERGIVTAVLWVSPPPFPVRVFTSPTDAETWVRGELKTRLMRK